MPSSRIILSLLGFFAATMATLGWTALGEPGFGATILDDRRAQYLISGLTLFSALAWFLTFYRPRGFRYLVCSRLLLSSLGCIFGACATLLVVEFAAPDGARAVFASSWQFWTYASAAMIACTIWTVVYYRSLTRVHRGGVPS